MDNLVVYLRNYVIIYYGNYNSVNLCFLLQSIKAILFMRTFPSFTYYVSNENNNTTP
jgi:hypothetical protein